MKTLSIRLFLIASLLAATVAQAQNKVVRIHSGGSVVYALNAAQIDSITFQDGTLPEPLINTKWKLNGLVNAETGAVTELEPKECKECYTLTFGTDYTGIAFSAEFPVLLNLMDLGDYEITDRWLLAPECYGSNLYEEGVEFRKAIMATKFCTATDDELRLYYGDKTSYLRFEPYTKSADDELNDLITSNLSKQGVSDSELLIGEWDFVAYAYTEDGIAISNIPLEKVYGYMQIKSTKANSWEGRWNLRYNNTITFESSISGSLVKLGGYSTTLIAEFPEEVRLKRAVYNIHSFVIKGDELIFYFTGIDGENILILKKL